METAVREIVASLGINVATKKLVCQEYCKINNLAKLSKVEKNEIHQIISRLIEELVANPDSSITAKDSYKHMPSNSEIPHQTDLPTIVKDDHLALDDGKENCKISALDVNTITHDEYLSPIKDLCRDKKKHVIQKSPSKGLPKRPFKRMRSKDVMDSIMNSDNECDSSLICKKNSPRKGVRKEDNYIYDDPPPRKPRPSKRKCEDVINSILDSSSDNDIPSDGSGLSPCKTPTKISDDKLSVISEDSPLFKPELSSRRNHLTSDSDESVDRVNPPSRLPKQNILAKRKLVSDTDSESEFQDDLTSSPDNSKNSTLRFNTFGSDSDSGDEFCNNVPKKSKSKNSVRKKKVETSDSENYESVNEKNKASQNYRKLIKQCRIVINDCLNSADQSCEIDCREKLVSDFGIGSKRKRTSSCSSSDVSDQILPTKKSKKMGKKIQSSDSDGNSSSDPESSRNIKKSKKMKTSSLSSDSDGNSSSNPESSQTVKKSKKMKTSSSICGSDRYSPGNSESLLSITKDKEVVKQGPSRNQPKLQEGKELKSLRAICRHIGVILRNTIELKDCVTEAEKIGRIKTLLHAKGMKGNPSMKKAEQFNLERELRELGGSTSDTGLKSPTKGSRRRVRRGRDVSSTSKTTPPVVPCDDFSHMKDIFCADDSSE